jgi:hypothetical protein
MHGESRAEYAARRQFEEQRAIATREAERSLGVNRVPVLISCTCSMYSVPHNHDEVEHRRFANRLATWWPAA